MTSGSGKKEGHKVTHRLLRHVRPRDTRRAVALSRVYSRWVGLLRWALPLLVLLVMTALIAWPMVRAKKLTAVVAQAIPNLVVENLRLSGVDAKNQPYRVTAARAMQEGDTKNLIGLETPQAEITLTTGNWISGKANYGRYDQQANLLWLDGNVQVFHDQGYRFSTNQAQVDMGQNTASGEQPVLIQGDFGQIKGQGFEILNKGKTLIIKGKTEARFNLRALPGSDKPPAKKVQAK